jgi:hypothetical protein
MTSGMEFEEFVHPTQASRVRLRVFSADGGGYLVVEERLGTAPVRSTLGLFSGKDEAAACLRQREKALLEQQYRRP